MNVAGPDPVEGGSGGLRGLRRKKGLGGFRAVGL